MAVLYKKEKRKKTLKHRQMETSSTVVPQYLFIRNCIIILNSQVLSFKNACLVILNHIYIVFTALLHQRIAVIHC